MLAESQGLKHQVMVPLLGLGPQRLVVVFRPCRLPWIGHAAMEVEQERWLTEVHASWGVEVSVAEIRHQKTATGGEGRRVYAS